MTDLNRKQYAQSEKFIFAAGVVGVVVMAYGLYHFKSNPVKLNQNDSNQINYEMAKLRTTDSLYSLENREIEIDYKALEIKKAALKANEGKKVQDKTKKVVAAKVATLEQQKAAQSAAANEAARAAKTAALKAAIIEDIKKNSLTDKNQVQPSSYADGSFPFPTKDTSKPKDESNKKSYEQWHVEIFSAQNREIILQLTAAYKKGDVTAEDFKKLVNDMLTSKNDKMVGLGIYALRANPSYSSYVQLVKIQNTVGSSYSTYIQESLMSYHQNGLGVLKQSLTSSDKVVILKTLEILKSGVVSIQSGNGTEIVDPRYRRTASTFTLASYVSFLPTLRDIVANSNDPELANLANQSIAIIDDPQYLAAN